MPVNKSSLFTDRASPAELIDAERILDELERNTDRWSKEIHERLFAFESQKPKLRKVTRGKLKRSHRHRRSAANEDQGGANEGHDSYDSRGPSHPL